MDEDEFIPDLNALLEVSLVEGNEPSSNIEETQTEKEKDTDTSVAEEKESEKTEEDEDKKQNVSSDGPPVSSEAAEATTAAATTPAAVEEPVQNGTQTEEAFKSSDQSFNIPELPDCSDQQKELYNFKFSLLPKDISEEEKFFYLNAIDDIKSVTCMRLHCTVCNDHIGCQPEAEENTFSHLNLHVLMCKQCYEFYGCGGFTVGPDGSETYCYWCGQGGQVLCCSTCTHVFCKKCVRVNFGRKAQKEIEGLTEWSCYACNPKVLWEFRAQCWGLLTFNEMRRNNLVSFTTDEELRLPGYNIVECCGVQRRAGKPLKIISFRYLIPRKKQEEKDKDIKAENDKVNNKNKPITSNGKVTYPLKILPKILKAEGDPVIPPVIPSTKEESSNSPVPTKPMPVPTKLTPVPVTLTPVPTKLMSALTVKTPGAVNAILPSPISPKTHVISDVIVPTSSSGGINTPQRMNYRNTTATAILRNSEGIIQRRVPVQRSASGGYMLVGMQSGNSTLVPVSAVRNVVQTPMSASREVNRTARMGATQPVTYDIDDDDDVVIIDDAFDNGVKKMALEWLVKSLDQAEKVSKVFQRQCENIKQTFMSEVKSNKIDAKRIRAFSGKMHNSLKRTAVKLACLDDKYITEAFSDWLKTEKLKHQKPPPPPPEPAPKVDTDLCLDMEISCESDNDEGEDDFETVFKKSVLDCPEALSDVELEDDVLNNITSSRQRDLLESLKQQTSSLKKQQCDMCIQTDQAEIEATSKKDEWSGAYSDFLVNRSVPDMSKQNCASSLNSDKVKMKDESVPPSENELLDPVIEEVPCDRPDVEEKSTLSSEKEVSDSLAEIELCDKTNVKEKSTLPSENEVSGPEIEIALCDKANVEEKSPVLSENEVSDPPIEIALCDKANVEETSPVLSENEVSDPVIETALCDKANVEENSPPSSENKVQDPLLETALCDKANVKEKLPLPSENDISDPPKREVPHDKPDTENKSPLPSEDESSNPLIEAACQNMPEVPRKRNSLKRASSSSPIADSKKIKLEPPENSLDTELDEDEDKYKRYGLKMCTIKLTDIEIKTE